jgi:hypothetical protein
LIQFICLACELPAPAAPSLLYMAIVADIIKAAEGRKPRTPTGKAFG